MRVIGGVVPSTVSNKEKNMKKVIMTSLFALTFASAANAGAYMTGFASTNSNNREDIFKKKTLNASIGYGFTNGLRVELDVFSANIDDGDDKTDLNLEARFQQKYLKALYDFKTGGKLTPYIGAGVRKLYGQYVKNDDDSKTRSYEFNTIGVAGVSFALNNNVSLDLQYNYAWNREYSKTSGAPSIKGEGQDNIYKLGVRYNF
jgi:opacity protein-like surface antigen